MIEIVLPWPNFFAAMIVSSDTTYESTFLLFGVSPSSMTIYWAARLASLTDASNYMVECPPLRAGLIYGSFGACPTGGLPDPLSQYDLSFF